MIQIRKILVPVDFSDASKRAIHYGVSLALQYNAKLVLAHIVPSGVTLAYAFPTESFSIEVDQAEKAKEELPLLVPEKFRNRINLETIVKVGNVQDELLGIARTDNVELMVMGTHGRGAVERFLLGSTTEKMLRKSPVPVLTLSHINPAKEVHEPDPMPLRKVLFATDFSEHAETGLTAAVELARVAHARLTILHVLQHVNLGAWGTSAVMINYASNMLESARQVALGNLEGTANAARRDGVEVQSRLEEGYPAHEILAAAKEINADLIVLNLQGRGAIDRALLGSTAERVIRMSAIPVLSVPVTDDDALPAMIIPGHLPEKVAR